MSRDGGTVLLWASFLAALGATAIIAFETSDPAVPGLFGGATLLMLLIAVGLLLGRRGRPDTGDLSARAVPDTSVATACLAVALAALALAAELGFWLALVALGIMAVGVGGLVREARASREMTDEWVGSSEATAGVEGRGPRFEAPGEE